MELNLPKPRKLPELSKLQALLLLGGAFVFVAYLLLRPYALVLDTSPIAPPRSEIALSVLRHDEAFLKSAAWEKFKAALPKEAQAALTQAAPGESTTLFAIRDENGVLRWGLAEALSSTSGDTQKPRRKLVRREVAALGAFVIDGRYQPFQAYFESELVRFEIGRSYRGLSSNAGHFMNARRLIQPIHQESIRLEKPSGVTWGQVPELLQTKMLRFQELASPWSWPGRVEFAVSASSTGETLNPFLLFYRPAVGQKNVDKQTESFAQNLLAYALPQTVLVSLPDDTKMTEFRYDPESLQKEVIHNQFGTLLRFTSPGKTQKMLVFQANDGEVWISNDLSLIQSGFLENIQASTPETACDRDTLGGFASFPFQNSQFGTFSKVNISLKNLETGLFTLCGYY